MILAIKTAHNEAEIGLHKKDEKIAYHKWAAGRDLSRDLLKEIRELLYRCDSHFDELKGIIVFRGPGSFTGLRIGISVANALAYSLNVPIVSTRGNSWIALGIDRLDNGEDEEVSTPFYGADANITKPKK